MGPWRVVMMAQLLAGIWTASVLPPTLGASVPSGALAPVRGKGSCLTSRSPPSPCLEVRAMRGPGRPAFSPDGRNAYVPASGSKSVVVLRRKGAQLVQAPGAAGCLQASAKRGCRASPNLIGPATDAAVSPDGHHVYVLAWRSIAAYVRNASTGALTPVSGTGGCLSVDGRGGCAPFRGVVGRLPLLDGSLVIARDGRTVYASSVTGSILVLRRDRVTGTLEQLRGERGCIADRIAGCAQGPVDADAATLAMSANDRAVYAFGIFHYGSFARDRHTGALGHFTPGHLRSLTAVDALAVAPDGRDVYAYSYGVITTLKPDVHSGALRQQSGAQSCVASPKEVSELNCGPAIGLGCQESLAISPDGRHVYAGTGCGFPGAVAAFARDRRTGALRQLPDGAGCLEPIRTRRCAVGPVRSTPALAISSDGCLVLLSVAGDRNDLLAPLSRRGCRSSTGVAKLAGTAGRQPVATPNRPAR
jgi:hypothetical protein